MVMSFSHRDQILWPVYITMGDSDTITWQSQKWLGTLLWGSISIIYELSKDINNKNKNLKTKIYLMILKIMLQYTYLSLPYKKNETLIIL